MSDIKDFANWLNNNWYEAYGLPNEWRLRIDTLASTPIYETFTTDELYEKWITTKIEERTVTKFLWLPFILKGKFKWLANVQIVERKVLLSFRFIEKTVYVWESDRFV